MRDIFKYQTVAAPGDLSRYFRTLADALENGSLPIMENENNFTLHPRGLVGLTIKARRKEGRSRVVLDLSWTEDNPSTPLLDDLDTGGTS